MIAVGYLFDAFDFEPGSRMTGLWHAGVGYNEGEPPVAMASLVQFGPDQHDELESDFFASHLPYHFGGFHGVGPDGHPWAVMLQVAPISAALLGGDPYWPMLDGLDRAWHYNWEATVLANRCLDHADLVRAYVDRGVDASQVNHWETHDLMFGLLAECCYVPLKQIVAGSVAQCAFPGTDHECFHDVFDDVFALWEAGRLWSPESPLPGPDDAGRYWWPKAELKKLSTKKLRKRALRGLWDKDEIRGMKRKQLIELLSTPQWNRMT